MRYEFETKDKKDFYSGIFESEAEAWKQVIKNEKWTGNKPEDYVLINKYPVNAFNMVVIAVK
jgi:hypothetical protein